MVFFVIYGSVIAGTHRQREHETTCKILGGRSTLFTTGPYSYVAYNGIGEGWDFIGLVVYKQAKAIMHKSCRAANHALTIDVSTMNALEAPAVDTFGRVPF
ncbi:MAG: hypothetical protein ACK5JE_12480 [Castellaniella sp.]|uniref:hypothetical protein n=1 Tax=Castellaniella sp. TaxID=1955812 RepID=UPI003A8B9743